MKNTRHASCSLLAIAKEAGVSTATVSYALRNKPGVSKKVQEKIRKIAKKQGYSPDSRLVSVMVATRKTRDRDRLPLAWLNNHIEENAWRNFDYLKPYYEGACERAAELGYHLEDVWSRQPGMSAKRLSRILYHRGIEGVIVTQYITHIRLDWDRLAAVALHGQLVVPRLPRVMPDLVHNLFLAMKQLRRLGYRRIGICLEAPLRNYAYVTLEPVADFLIAAAAKADRVPPLFYRWGRGTSKSRDEGLEAKAWIRKHRPEAIICHSSMLLSWVQQLELLVPGDIALAHLATDDDVCDWAGIHSNRRAIGAAAVDQVAGRIMSRQFGLSPVAQDTLLRGDWHTGWTVGRRTASSPAT